MKLSKTENATYTVLGMSTDQNSCDCCGKDGLKKTVAMIHNSTQSKVYFGTTCATKIEKYNTLEELNVIKEDIKTAKSVASKKYNQLGYERDERTIRLLNEWDNFKDVRELKNISSKLKSIREEYKYEN